MDRVHTWKLIKSSNISSDNIISSKRQVRKSMKSSNVSPENTSDNIISSKRKVRKSIKSSIVSPENTSDNMRNVRKSFNSSNVSQENIILCGKRNVNKAQKIYQCDFCEKLFSKKTLLHFHMERVHQQRESNLSSSDSS